MANYDTDIVKYDSEYDSFKLFRKITSICYGILMLADFATDVTCLVLASDAKFLESEAAIADYFYHYAFFCALPSVLIFLFCIVLIMTCKCEPKSLLLSEQDYEEETCSFSCITCLALIPMVLFRPLIVPLTLYEFSKVGFKYWFDGFPAFFHIIGESIPIMALNIIIMSKNGGPLNNKLQLASCVVSGVTIIIGIMALWLQWIFYRRQVSGVIRENNNTAVTNTYNNNMFQ